MTNPVHILLTDDESGLRTAMGRLLGRSGHVVKVATTGLEAWEMIAAAEAAGNPFDLLITDVNMPTMRGDELVARLRSENREIEILVISGFGDKSLVVDLMRMGVEHYMDKPFSANEFEDKVVKICDQIQKKRQAALRSRNMEIQLASLSTDLVRYRRGFDEMQAQMDLAVRSYQSLVNLPQRVQGLEFECRVRPLHDLGGDFLGINPLKDGVEILLADVAGHDMGASYVTILLKSFFENNKDVMADGDRFFHVLNSGLIEQGSDRMVSALHVRIDYGMGRVVVTTAAHPSPILLKLGLASTTAVHCWGDPLGISPEVAFSKWESGMIPGDRLLLFTDGLPSLGRFDPLMGRRQELSESGMERLMAGHRHLPLREAVGRIWDDSLAYANFNPNDDLLLLGVEIAEEQRVQG